MCEYYLAQWLWLVETGLAPYRKQMYWSGALSKMRESFAIRQSYPYEMRYSTL